MEEEIDFENLTADEIFKYAGKHAINIDKEDPFYQKLYPAIKRALSHFGTQIEDTQCCNAEKNYKMLIHLLPLEEIEEEMQVLETLLNS